MLAWRSTVTSLRQVADSLQRSLDEANAERRRLEATNAKLMTLLRAMRDVNADLDEKLLRSER
jgi:DNA repair ATPase RecN